MQITLSMEQIYDLEHIIENYVITMNQLISTDAELAQQFKVQKDSAYKLLKHIWNEVEKHDSD